MKPVSGPTSGYPSVPLDQIKTQAQWADNGQDLFFAQAEPEPQPTAENQPDEADQFWPAGTIPQSPEDLLRRLGGRQVCQPVQTLFVIGAHRFQERDLLQQVFPNLQSIILVEPIPALAQELRQQYGPDPRIRVIPAAVADFRGTAPFYLTSNDAASSSLLEFGSHTDLFPDVTVQHAIQVPVYRLSDLIEEYGLPEPDVLFLDVQGAEYQVLSALSPSTRRQLKLVYTEASTELLYKGSRRLEDLDRLLEPDFDRLGFAPMSATVSSHGNALYIQHALRNKGLVPALRSMWAYVDPFEKREWLPAVTTALEAANAAAADSRWDEAAQDLNKAIQADPSDARLYHWLGNILLQLQQVGAALRTFQIAVEIEPAYLPAMLDLGQMQLFLGNLPEARKLAVRAASLDPVSSPALQLLANAAEAAGSVGEATGIANLLQALAPTGSPDTGALPTSNPGAVCPVNTDYIEQSRLFWNTGDLESAMFERILPERSLASKPADARLAAWDRSADSSMNKVLAGLRVNPGWSALEIGCGIGRVMRPLRHKLARVDGVDFAEDMVHFSQDYLRGTQSRGRVAQNNGWDLAEFPSGAYNLVYSVYVFQHIRSASVVHSYLRECARILQPGGYLRLQVQDTSNPVFGHFLEEYQPGARVGMDGNGYTPAQLELLLKLAGFPNPDIFIQGKTIWATAQKLPLRID